MADFLSTPAPYVLIGLVLYYIAYRFYARWIDKRVWEPDPKRSTPATMYMDGVEYFPVNRYVLYGFQFKSVAALGPIVGPVLAVQYWGWLPSLFWIVIGVIFIGWAQDYSAMFLSVRNEGRSFGPITYNLVGKGARSVLLSYLFIYFWLLTAAFVYILAATANGFSGSFYIIFITLLSGVILGQLVFKARWNIFYATILALILVAIGYVVGYYVQFPATNFLGVYGSVMFWSIIFAIILAIAAIVPLPSLILPFNYLAFYPAIASVALVIISALLSPISGVSFTRPAFVGFTANFTGFPLWPLLFVTIACGAISGWHSLVSSGTTSKQVESEIDALPVGGGAMFTESIVALSAFAAISVISATVLGANGYVLGAATLASGILGKALYNGFVLFFGAFLLFMGFTVETLVIRYWRLVLADMVSERKGSIRILGNKYVATTLILVLALALIATFTFDYIWEYFGGTNQLFAAFALLLVATYLTKVKKPSWYTLIPGSFMIVTTIAAIAYTAYLFLSHSFNPTKPLTALQQLFYNFLTGYGITPYPIVSAFDVIAFLVGLSLVILSITMGYYLFKSILTYRKEAGITQPIGGKTTMAKPGED